MEIIRDFSNYNAETPVSVALGNFDGLHCGHQHLLERTKALAGRLGVIPAVITFSPHPVKAKGKAISLICTDGQKFKLLESYGIEKCFVIPFTEAFADLTPEEFVQHYIVDKINAKAVVAGANYCFGKDRAGTADVLKRLCASHNIVCDIVNRLTVEGTPVSSSRVRAALLDGSVESASGLLKRFVEYSGTVERGENLGTQIGFPTANLSIDNELIPSDGVYAGYTVQAGIKYPVMVYIGTRPTVSDKGERRFEVNIIDYTPAQPLYGQELSVFLGCKIRDGKKFNSVEELKTALFADREAAKSWFKRVF